MTNEMTISLSLKERLIFYHYVIEGKTIEETANCVNASKPTVEKILQNVKERCGIETRNRNPLIYFLTKNNLI